MHPIAKKQKILYILAAAGFVLLALALLFLLLQGSFGSSGEPETTPAPTVTAAPSAEALLTVGGTGVDPAASSLELSGKTLTADDLTVIGSLHNLTTLSLTRCNITDLRFLLPLTQLRTLYLSDNLITDVSPLASLGELRTLYLDRNPVGDLSPLTALTALTTLSMQGVEVADYVLEDIQTALPGCRVFYDSVVEGSRPVSLGGLDFTESVETLDLSGRGITDISALSGCDELRELNLSNNPITDIAALALLPKLTTLNLSATGRSDSDFELLSSLRSLAYLNLENNDGVTAEGIDALEAALPNCQIVHEPKYYTVIFGGQSFSSDSTDVSLDSLGLASLTGLEKFHQLRRLSACGNSLGELSPLAELFSVEELRLGYNNLTDITALTAHTALRRLDLSHNALRDITALSGCTALEELDLSYNNLNSLTALRSLAALRTLNITGNGELTADMVRSLQEALPACQIVTDIDLSMPEPTPEAPTATPVPQADSPAPPSDAPNI